MNQRVLIINGFAVDESVWIPLKDTFRKAQIECFIHSHERAYTKEKLIEDTYDFINDFKSEQFILLTWSLGTLLTLELSSRLNHLNYDLVIINGTCDFCNKTFGLAHAIVSNMVLSLELDLNKTMYAFIKKCSRTMNYTGKFHDLEVLKVALSYLKSTSLLDISVLNKSLIIHGSRDRICSLEAGKYLNKRIKGSEMIVIDAGNHLMFYHDYNKIFTLIQERYLCT